MYVGFNIYQTNHMEIIPYSDITSINVVTDGALQADTLIQVAAEVDAFEAIASEIVQKEVVEDTLYLIVYKWPAFIQVDEIEFRLDKVNFLDQVEQISLIYGKIYSGEGESRGIYSNDFLDHPDQKIIWLKEDLK